MESAAGILECSLCLSEFNDPRALPCLHTFCYRCLSNLFIRICNDNQYRLVNINKFKCPICQEQHDIPQNGAQGFRKDFRIKSFMEMNKTEGKSVRPTLCQSHPGLELAHFCPEINCKGAVICTECADQNHRNHQIIPMKSLCEAKKSHMKLMKEAIEQNRKQVQSARKKLEENKSEMHNLLKRRLNEFQKQLDEKAKTNANYTDKMIGEAHNTLTVKESDIKRAEADLKVLETGFNNTISNIIRADADKHLDKKLKSVYKTLKKWSLKYSLLKFMDSDPLTRIKKDWVVKMPEDTVKGVSVSLSGPMVPSAEPNISTLTPPARSLASTIKTPRQTNRNSLTTSAEPELLFPQFAEPELVFPKFAEPELLPHFPTTNPFTPSVPVKMSAPKSILPAKRKASF